MSELLKLFEERDKEFMKMSEEIIKSLPNVIKGCKEFVHSKGSTADEITWLDITHLDDHDMIVLIGIIKFLPGETVKMPDGSTAVVTEDNQDYFKSMLRLGIPFKLAENGTSQEIYEFLIETIETETVDVPHGGERNDTEFKLDELSEEQRKTLEMFKTHDCGKG